MKRRDVLKAMASAASLAYPASKAIAEEQTPSPRPKGPRARKPNILFICTDQERLWHDLPADLPLPGHDWLRSRGTSFENHHVNTSPCGPSRSTIYTGLHIQHTKVYLNPDTPPRPHLSPDIPTIGSMLRSQGYYTAYKGKWHISNLDKGVQFITQLGPHYPDARDVLEPYGFSDYQFNGERLGLSWDGYWNDHMTAAEAAGALRNFADGKTDGKPWFLAVNFVNPHDIMFFDATGKGEQTRIRPDFLAPLLPAPADPIYDKDWKAPLPKSFYADDLSTKPRSQKALETTLWWLDGKVPVSDETAWHAIQNYYFNCICDVDRHVRRVVGALEEAGLANNTIVVFTADHGEAAGAHRMKEKIGTIYKEMMRVPFIVVHPDGRGGRTTTALSSTVDIVPTLLSLAGLSQSEVTAGWPQLKGCDLSAAVGDAGAKTQRDERGILFNYLSAYFWNAPDPKPGVQFAEPLAAADLNLRRLYRGAYDGRYKFARYFAPSQHHTPVTFEQLAAYNDLELYDTARDPDELVNLAYRPQAAKETLMRLNAMTNSLVADEIGSDKGEAYPGPLSQYNTLGL